MEIEEENVNVTKVKSGRCVGRNRPAGTGGVHIARRHDITPNGRSRYGCSGYGGSRYGGSRYGGSRYGCSGYGCSGYGCAPIGRGGHTESGAERGIHSKADQQSLL
jgi:hypothetical protein